MPGRRRSTRYYDFEDDHGEENSNDYSGSNDGEDQEQSAQQRQGETSSKNGKEDHANVAIGWPRRLLHVGTMTSYTRSASGNNVSYGNINNPEFNVMSYTWGRFEDPNGEAVRINNIEWPIPKIRPDVFTPAEFRRALHEAAGDRDFVWVDIACINQNSGAEKSEEVGNQAAIFHRAKEVVIWLHGIRTRDIESAIDTMVRTIGEAQQSGNTAPTQSGDEEIRTMTALLKDPWFSSMWTLQEAFLRKNAAIMSKEAEVVEPHSLRDVMTLHHVTKIGTMLHHYDCRPVQEAITSAGLRELDATNPLVLISAARHRTTTRPADRIYGIMQAFDVKIGNTARGVDPVQYFSLVDLESQLSTQINSSLPTIAQLFVHLIEPRFGKAWGAALGIAKPDPNLGSASPQIGSNSSVYIPPEFFNVSQKSRECQISFFDGRPYFEGMAWRLEALVDQWVKDEGFPEPAEGAAYPDDEKTPGMNTFSRSIFIDQTSVFLNTAGNAPPNMTSMAKPVTIGVDLVQKYPGKFLILVLGEIQEEDSGDETSVGVIVRNEGRSKEGLYRRLGFCTWQGKAVDAANLHCQLG